MNTTADDNVIVKGGGGGVTINNQDKVVEIVENGTTEVVADAGFTGLGKVTVNVDVPSSGGGGGVKWTGHADVEGLKAIGWTDEDIAYYQEHGVNWNEEDDEYHKVTDDNKALYGVLTADNISTYKARIVYLPKVDISGKTDMNGMFSNCYSLVAIPQLDTQNVTNMGEMFSNCYSLVAIPLLDTQNVTNMYKMFSNCYSLVSVPQLDTQNITSLGGMFYNCYSLVAIPQLNTQNITSVYQMFYNCYSLVAIPQLDTQNVTNMNSMFYNCISLTHTNLKNVKLACDLSSVSKLTKESLLYLINNEAATSAITIKLSSYAYNKWSTDADVVAALEAHPNISISQ